jgi:hypothetical protein
MKTSRKIKIIKIINVLDNVILTTLRSYLNHHLQVKIIEAKVKIVEQFAWQFTLRFIWRFIQKFRIIQLRITEFTWQFRITQHCPFKLPMQLLASKYHGLSIIIQI